MKNNSEIKRELRIAQRNNNDFPYYRWIRSGDLLICIVEGNTPEIAEENANKIIKCVNSHDELVAALKAFISAGESMPKFHRLGRINSAYNQAKATLEKLEPSMQSS